MQINLHIKEDRVVSIPNQQTDYQKYNKKNPVPNYQVVVQHSCRKYCDKYVLLEPCSNSILVHLRKKINIFQAAHW